MAVEDDTGCICKGNWRKIIEDHKSKFGTLYKNSYDGEIYRLIGVMHCNDDYYYCMQDDMDRIKMLSCVGYIENFGYEELE